MNPILTILVKGDWEVNEVNLVFSAEKECISSRGGMNFYWTILWMMTAAIFKAASFNMSRFVRSQIWLRMDSDIGIRCKFLDGTLDLFC